MKIARIALTNFGPFGQTEVQFDQPLSIIRGLNASGKTTINEGIKLALTKSSYTTDPRGAGANDAININAKKAEIIVGIDGKGGALELRVSYGPNKQGRLQNIVGGGPGVAEAFAGFMERNTERLSCVLDSEYFLSPKTDQKAILAALVLPETYDWDPEIQTLVETYLGKQDWTRNPAGLIDWIYGDDRRGAYGERKTAKALLNAAAIPPNPQKPEYTDKDEIQGKLYELRKKHATEAGKLRRTTAGQVPRAELALENAEKAVTEQESVLRQNEQRYAEIDKTLLSGTTVKKHQKIAAERVTFNELQGQIDTIYTAIQANKEAVGLYEDLRESPFCPTCTQEVTQQFIDGKVATLEESCRELGMQVEHLMRRQGALGDIAAAEKALKTDADAKAQRDQIGASIKALEQRIPELKKAVASAQEALDAARAEDAIPQDTTALDSLSAEISQWEAHLSPAIRYESVLQEIERAKEKRSSLSKKVADLERLCSVFGKDGIRADLIAEYQCQFVNTLNFALAFWGYEARLEMDPYSFEVNNGDGWIPVKRLSGAEGLFFRVALQTAIAIQSGLRIIVVDKFDTMIENERARAVDCISALLEKGELDQAIVIGADGRKEAPAVDGVGFYFVENRQVQRI